MNCGQICIAPDHVLVHKSLVDEFLELVQKYTHEMFTSETAEGAQAYGKIINEFHLKRIKGYLENHGGKLICGGHADEKTLKLDPTIVLNPNKDSKLYNNEVFGPIMKVTTFTSIDSVIYDIN